MLQKINIWERGVKIMHDLNNNNNETNISLLEFWHISFWMFFLCMAFCGFLILEGMYNQVPFCVFLSSQQKQFSMQLLIIVSKLSKNPLLHSAYPTFQVNHFHRCISYYIKKYFQQSYLYLSRIYTFHSLLYFILFYMNLIKNNKHLLSIGVGYPI